MSLFSKTEIGFRKMKEGGLFKNAVGVNETALLIWEMCNGESTTEDIIKVFYEKYGPETDDEKNMIKEDIQTCLEELVEGGLLLKSNDALIPHS